MGYSVYVLKSKSRNKIYTGFTQNIKERLRRHNKGYVQATKSGVPWELCLSEDFDNRILAKKREQFLKSGKGRLYIKRKLADGDLERSRSPV